MKTSKVLTLDRTLHKTLLLFKISYTLTDPLRFIITGVNVYVLLFRWGLCFMTPKTVKDYDAKYHPPNNLSLILIITTTTTAHLMRHNIQSIFGVEYCHVLADYYMHFKCLSLSLTHIQTYPSSDTGLEGCGVFYLHNLQPDIYRLSQQLFNESIHTDSSYLHSCGWWVCWWMRNRQLVIMEIHRF